MKTLRRSMIYFVIFFAGCLFVVDGAQAQSGVKFWAMDVGNYWVLNGSNPVECLPNLCTWTWRNDVVSLDTTTISGVTTYKVEGRVPGGPVEEKHWYSINSTEMRMWRAEFFDDFSGWHTVTMDGGIRTGDNTVGVGGFWEDNTTGTWDGANININVRNDVVSYEDVIVPLGTYRAYKIVRTITIPQQGGDVENLTSWFVPYIGVVKYEYNMGPEGIDTEVLASMKIKKDIADFDGDGWSDLAGLTSGGNIFYSTNRSTWTQIPGVLDQLVVGDFSTGMDGKSDLAGLTSNGLIFYTTDRSTWTQIPGVLDQLVVGDFNGDGTSDLAGLTSNGLIFYTTNRSTWTQIPGALSQLVVGDFNGDGTSDLAGLTSDGLIFYSTNRSTWAQIPGALDQLVVGDFNGDGTSDLAGLTSNGLIFYTTNRSTWTQIPGALSQLVVGDFTGDGTSDLAGLTSGGNIFYSTNRSTWTQIPGALDQLVVGDFDGDGLSELAGLTSGGLIFYTTNLSIWTQIPGALLELAK